MDGLLKFFTRFNLENAWPSKKEARWWFQIFFMFIPIWGRFPFWLFFFRWVETTNQEGDPFLEGAMGFSGHPGLVSGLIPRPGDIKSQREFLVRKGAEKTSKEGWNRLKPAKTNRFMEVGWGGYLFEKVVFFLEDSDPETNDILYCFFLLVEFACHPIKQVQSLHQIIGYSCLNSALVGLLDSYNCNGLFQSLL